jgi:hypothetical protein
LDFIPKVEAKDAEFGATSKPTNYLVNLAGFLLHLSIASSRTFLLHGSAKLPLAYPARINLSFPTV